jgi:hypothetical protein
VVTKLQVAEYMRDVALHTVLGPYGIPIIGVNAARDAYEGDYSGVARGAAVEAGSITMGYSMLKLLNYLQGPKYAMSYRELHKSMNPLRNLGVGAVVTNPAVIVGAAVAGMALMTAKRPDLTQHTYQTAQTGQPSVGTGGHSLIYGNRKGLGYFR